MQLIRRGAIRAFAEHHPDALEPLLLWANAVESMRGESPADLQRIFPSVEFQDTFTVFNVGGTHQAIALVHYVRQVIFLAIGAPTVDVDVKRYGQQLAKALPTEIHSQDENNRTLAVIEELMEKGEDQLTPREDAFLDLLVDLVYTFEEINEPLPECPPHKMIAFLLEQRGLAEQDLWPVLGSETLVSEILFGHASLSKNQARPLAAFFHVGVEILT